MSDFFDGEAIIRHAEYHRNGVSGESFVSAIVSGLVDGRRRDFLATFTTTGDDEVPDPTTCRVVDVNDPTSNWRGDRFGWEFGQLIYDQMRARLDAELARWTSLAESSS